MPSRRPYSSVSSSSEEDMEEDYEMNSKYSKGKSKSYSPVYQEVITFDNLISNKARNRLLFSMTNVQGSTRRSRTGFYTPLTWKQVIRKYRWRILSGFVTFVMICFILQFYIHDKFSMDNQNPQKDGNFHHGESWEDDLSTDGTIPDLIVDLSHPKSIPICRPVVSGASTTSDTSSSSCSCTNPLTPFQGPNVNWSELQRKNVQMIDPAIPYDILFVGDSITYYWNKTPIDDTAQKGNQDTVLSQAFAGWNVVALGIPGDTISSLLYRLNVLKEFDSFRSAIDYGKQGAVKLVWVLIGTNDIRFGCSDEIIYAGIVNYVEELLKFISDKKNGFKDATIVINGILPRSSFADGRLANFNTELSNQRDANAPEVQDSSHGPFSTLESEEPFDFWTSIKRINKALKLYATKNERVEYYDASEVFVGHIGNKYFQEREEFLMKELQYDFLHPSSLGYLTWAKHIQDYITSDLDVPNALKGESV